MWHNWLIFTALCVADYRLQHTESAIYNSNPLPTNKIFSSSCGPFLVINKLHVIAKPVSNSFITKHCWSGSTTYNMSPVVQRHPVSQMIEYTHLSSIAVQSGINFIFVVSCIVILDSRNPTRCSCMQIFIYC